MARAILTSIWERYTVWGMTREQYNLLRQTIEERYEVALSEARNLYEKSLQSLEFVWTLAGRKDLPQIETHSAGDRDYGDLMNAVRVAVVELQFGFTAEDVERYIQIAGPSSVLSTNPWSLRKSVSSALRRLAKSGFVRMEAAGKGNSPAVYSRNSDEELVFPQE